MSEEEQNLTSPSPDPSLRSTPSPEHPEDQPLGGAGRSFTQLLVDQLGEVEDKDISHTEAGKLNSEPKPFLRRGTGLTRFNLPPDPTQQPSQRKRSQSQPRVGDVKSRLSQETQSFANKKTLPKRSVSISPAMQKRKPKINPVSPAKLKSPNKNSRTINSSPNQNVIDSVGNTLQQKLKIRKDVHNQDFIELALFEMLEEDTGWQDLYNFIQKL